ncbi:hypothetical protein RND81_02G131700 [Saponaria officinalis]|uniref:Late embryogenesis abundant protein LEA-2 subgroup domain-containing protein n=1 Tax=Saponaria officinalis TaxID=3572 RepID=A0AAW1MQ80_SAPOF
MSPRTSPPLHLHHQPPHSPSKTASKTLPSCILTTSFVLFLALTVTITTFILLWPQHPTISVTSIKLSSFTLHDSTANFTFFQYTALRNPNRYAFSHHSSFFQLISSSSGPLGFAYIPAEDIPARLTRYISATFVVKSFLVADEEGVTAVAESGSVVGPGPTMELETRVELVGSVKVMQVFERRVQKGVRCRVSVLATDGSLLGYHC